MTTDTLDLCDCDREELLDRDDLPHLLVTDHIEGAIPPGCLPHRLEDAWLAPGYPGRTFGVGFAVSLFREAGYMSDTDGTPPTEPIEVYRAQVDGTLGMSWTTERRVAEWFHDRNLFYGFGDRAILLRGIVEPEGVLAYWREARTEPEHEVVIDPKHLRRPVERLTYAAPTTPTGGTPWTLTSWWGSDEEAS